MFTQDEANFGRISEIKRCWCPKGKRPVIPKQQEREYLDVWGAVNVETGKMHAAIYKKGKDVKGRLAKGEKSKRFNDLLRTLSEAHPDYVIFLICDNAGWHKSQYTEVPDNIHLIFIPPYTPEMNPQEQVWRELRAGGFHNNYFETLDDVEAQLLKRIQETTPETFQTITQRDWIMKLFDTC